MRTARAIICRTMCVAGCVVMAACGAGGPQARLAAADAASARTPIERGKYLVAVTGCNDCHTTKKMGPNGPEPDMSLMLAGQPEGMKLPPAPRTAPGSPWIVAATPTLTAWSGPWGVSFATNLTPDRNTGLGTWSEETFMAAMRTGKHMGRGRAILPPMPWQDFARMSDADLKAIYAYLRTIPPIVNHVPDPVPPPADR